MNFSLLQSPFKTKKEALTIVGGLSSPSKMPGYGWSISAKKCKRGSKMALIEGSTCHSCYANKGRYRFKNVQDAMERRLKNLSDPMWIPAMVFLLKDEKYFRWFDSGDLQSKEHLEKIITVVESTPNCKHWLPTREFSVIKEYLEENTSFPKNICVRMSSDFVDQRPMREYIGACISTTSKDKWIGDDSADKVHNCPVAGNHKIKSCAEANCDACWDTNTYHINYKIH